MPLSVVLDDTTWTLKQRHRGFSLPFCVPHSDASSPKFTTSLLIALCSGFPVWPILHWDCGLEGIRLICAAKPKDLFFFLTISATQWHFHHCSPRALICMTLNFLGAPSVSLDCWVSICLLTKVRDDSFLGCCLFFAYEKQPDGSFRKSKQRPLKSFSSLPLFSIDDKAEHYLNFTCISFSPDVWAVPSFPRSEGLRGACPSSRAAEWLDGGMKGQRCPDPCPGSGDHWLRGNRSQLSYVTGGI